MFGAIGQQSSQDMAVRLGTICTAEVRLSYFVFFAFGYSVLRQMTHAASATEMFWVFVKELGDQVILMGTVLCHEFGHGNMARYLGGTIDHILLWVFGGICFSTRPTGAFDNDKLLKDDLLIVAAGPSTHFVQAPAWGMVAWLVFWLVSPPGMDLSAWAAIQAAINPWARADLSFWRFRASLSNLSALFWGWATGGIYLNIVLFLFNVFVPMYPSDGAKLLVTGLMFFVGVTPRTAALVLVLVTVPCAGLLILHALHGLAQTGNYMGTLSGFMAVMSLSEAYKIWQMRNAKRLHEHSLFATARSWQRRERDAFGYVSSINTSAFDDEAPLTNGGFCGRMCRSLFQRSQGGASWSCAGCLACLFPCLVRVQARDLDQPLAGGSPGGAPGGAPSAGPNCDPCALEAPPAAVVALAATGDQLRSQRGNFLDAMDQQRAERDRTVREYMSERYGGSSLPRAAQ